MLLLIKLKHPTQRNRARPTENPSSVTFATITSSPVSLYANANHPAISLRKRPRRPTAVNQLADIVAKLLCYHLTGSLNIEMTDTVNLLYISICNRVRCTDHL